MQTRWANQTDLTRDDMHISVPLPAVVARVVVCGLLARIALSVK
jgi:hypothetical protein